jgi:vacuolar iron transporter family protein
LATTLALADVAKESAGDEYSEYVVYQRLAKRGRSGKEVFSKLSEMEYTHYEFWHKYCPEYKPKVNRLTLYFMLFIRTVFGATFVFKYLERNETKAVTKYESIRSMIPEADRERFERIILDEKEHENALGGAIKGSYVKYISFIILGLADAIVEISGIHAGSLGLYRTTELTGLAGIMAGAAASLAMASAAFAQAKQGFQGSASISAVATGVSYFVNAVVLALPYFFTKVMLNAIISSVILATVIIAFTSYYNSVVSSSSFRRDFSELAGVMLGATVALYAFGTLLKSVFGISI